MPFEKCSVMSAIEGMAQTCESAGGGRDKEENNHITVALATRLTILLAVEQCYYITLPPKFCLQSQFCQRVVLSLIQAHFLPRAR